MRIDLTLTTETLTIYCDIVNTNPESCTFTTLEQVVDGVPFSKNVVTYQQKDIIGMTISRG